MGEIRISLIQYGPTGKPIIQPNQDDPRYTLGIYLLREKRPKYWNFRCNFCGEKVIELNGSIIYISDVAVEANAVNRVRCNSRQCGGRVWYEFNLAN